MKTKTKFVVLAAILLALTLITGAWGEASAAGSPHPTRTVAITAGQAADVWFGHGGMYIHNPVSSGEATISRMDASAMSKAYVQMKAQKLVNRHRYMELHLFDAKGQEEVNGNAVYVYFNLTLDDSRLWKNETLGIYRYDAPTDTWVECSSFVVPFGQYGRVTCLTTRLGLYSLMAEPKSR